jgi:hypothetical protein
VSRRREEITVAQGKPKNWRELCNAALAAKDPDELLKILQELNQALKREEQVRRDFREAMRTTSPRWNPMLTTIRGTTTRAHISHTKEPTRMREIRVLCVENHPEYTSALQYMLEKELCDPLQALKRCGRGTCLKQGEGAEFLGNEGVLTDPYC